MSWVALFPTTILPSTLFAAISLLLAYGSKPNFSKSVILSVSDSEPDEDRDFLEDMFLPNKMIRKMNFTLLIVP